MWLNLLVAAIIGGLTYGLTLYLDGGAPPPTVTVAPQPGNSITIIEPGKSTPDFSFVTLAGEKHGIRDFNGKIVLLNFWATWCPPCIAEMPVLLKISKTHDKDVVLIALSSDLDSKTVTDFLDKIDADTSAANILVALDEQNRITHDFFQSYRLPETVIIDKTGQMRGKLIGASWSAEDLEKMLVELK